MIKIILPASIILGLAVSIRIFGIWAGILVAGYALWKSGMRIWLVITVYALMAIIAMYLTWPYLWPNPIGHFLETVQVMARHPWPGNVLFNGKTYPANDLPASYVPTFLAIQLTEPVWLLFFIGVGAAVFGAIRKRAENGELLALSAVWFLLPLLTFVILRPTLYDNFRQTFFIVPPIFFMTGLAFEQIRKPILQGTLIALVLLPGLIASARLHPYEYVYYNQFVGGAEGSCRSLRAGLLGNFVSGSRHGSQPSCAAECAISGWTVPPISSTDLHVLTSIFFLRRKRNEQSVMTWS